ncbi:MAG TPA: magnesium/cobalt transporter CorA [Pricia sp.]|nr:magnesium/cobalt transporter CorA [Pricia sp.]
MRKSNILGKRKSKKVSLLQKKRGKAPGTITYMGNREKERSTVKIMEYNADMEQEFTPKSVAEIDMHTKPGTITWIDVAGLTDEAFIEKLGKEFGLNPLILEDTLNIGQRPKIDEYDTYIFGIFKMLYLNENNELVLEHLGLVLLDDSVMVFQEEPLHDVFDGVRERIRSKTGRIRYSGADYLFFALLDSVIDNYFVVLENINLNIETLEEEVYQNPTPETAIKIQQLKKEVLKIRRLIYPVKELISRLIDTENPLITKDTKLFLRDALDHSVEINETLQIYREMSMSLLEMYMSNISNKMNEVMKVLTIMASIFIPLTFIVGVYGMNFDHMPELHWKYGYFGVWGVMILLFVGMLIYFRRKNWI